MFIRILFCSVSVLFAANIFSQSNLLDSYKNNPNFEVKLFKDSTVEFYDKSKNYHWQKTIAAFPEYDNTTVANLIIELDTVNFALYDSYYRLWGYIPAVNTYGSKYIAVDTDEDGKNEIYGYGVQYNQSHFFYQPAIYNQVIDSLFTQIYAFPDSGGPFYDVGDITGDGLLDLNFGGFAPLKFYKQNTTTGSITDSNFTYNPFGPVYQFNDVTFYDIDGDGNQEIVYYLFAGEGDSVWSYSNHVAKYNPQINNYELIYYDKPQPEYFTSGISTGDFDQDGKGNFATGSIGGKFYVYEYIQGTQYQVEFTKELETYNAFLTIMTDDMDGNGKPEIWIGGDFGSSQYGGVTRLFAFEASSPGVYEQVYQIDIRGLFSFIYGKLRYTDLDGDGKKDLFLTNANLAFGFKYDGNGNYYMDFVKSMPELDSIYVYQSLDRVDIADLDGDGKAEIIPEFTLYKGWEGSLELRSVFLKRDKLTGIKEENTIYPAEFNLMQNYPNPFNPATNIKFTVSSESKISIRIFSVIGKEIKELINDTRISGEYETTWDGTDNLGNKVSSGVYFITMEANSFTQNSLPFRKTIKSILLK
jgi:FlgD Ig-like domain/FG-GAP-like repeat